jgi:hypothetical protein
MLGLIYIFSTAKPISLRRLSLLFVSALVLARFVLGVLQIGQASRIATIVSVTLIIGVWIAPLFRLIRDTIRSSRLELCALDSTSGNVQCTYALAPIILTLLVVDGLLNPVHIVTISAVLRSTAIAMPLGIGLLACAHFQHPTKKVQNASSR